MSILYIINTALTVCTYIVTLFFLVAIVRTFVKTKSIQDALVYCVIMVPFVLRMLRLK